MGGVRNCERLGTGSGPRREHARFGPALCRITCNREHAAGEVIGDTLRGWSVSALAGTVERLCTAGALNLPGVLALLH
jgi:hypothetical protein